LWFQHFRRAGGTSLCHALRSAVPAARFLLARGEACQPEEWKLRDAVAICENNFTLLATELDILGGNAFAQEYGSVPGPWLLGHRVQRRVFRDWVFVTTMREPWGRFWSQLRYEMATCLVSVSALAHCIGGNFESLGHWWSPTAHRDSVLGVPGASIGPSPALYVDNYYTRVLLNRTDVNGPPLTESDLRDAMILLEDRVSAIVILEDFARSALQLACSLGLDLREARRLFRTHVRPYEAQEALMSVPTEEGELGQINAKALRSRFVTKNKFDYALYSHARILAQRRLAACANSRADVKELWRSPPADVVDEDPSEEDPAPTELTVDDMFGCTGGSLHVSDDGQYTLLCPRSAAQHAASWWSAQSKQGEPKRKIGQKLPGAECWRAGFSWATCCI